MKTFATTLALFAALVAGAAAQEDTRAPFAFDIPDMKEEAQAAGITHSYDGPWEYFVGGGAAGFDCNGDRMPDIFIAGGTSPASLYVNRSRAGGELRFEETPLDVPERDLLKVTGAYPVNLDNDAHMDLVVLRVGGNLLLKGLGECRFRNANRELAFDGGRDWTTAFSATWEEGSRFPTLVFGNYVDRSAPGSPWGTCADNRLLRAAGDGETPDYSQNLMLSPGYCALSMLFTDWNNSGVPALRVTNDRQYYRGGQEQLWALDAGRPPRQYTASDGWRRLQIWGMGIAEADLDSDGWPEYALTSMGDTKLQSLDEETEGDEPVYNDIAFDRGATAHRPYTGDDSKPSTGWHSQFADVNNDGHIDLFIAKGNVEAMPDFAAYDPDNLLLCDEAGKFHEMGDKAGIALDTKGRGGLVQDFNADGMLDMLVVNRGQQASLFRNRGAKTGWGHRPMGNWLMVELHNGEVNPSAVGAKISIRTGTRSQTRTVQVGGGHASGQAGFVHFGVGVAERVSVRIKWPDGSWSHPYRVFANNFVVLKRSEDEALYWYPVTQ